MKFGLKQIEVKRMSEQKRDERTCEIIEILRKHIINPQSELNFNNNFQLLIAVILSAQCTDMRVNQVTKTLFSIAPDPKSMAALSLIEIEKLIYQCGYYKNKAKFLRQASVDIIKRFNGQVPNTIEELKTLDGVGEKTARVVFAVGFGGQAIAVDTHVFRVSNRLGIAEFDTPIKVQRELENKIPKQMWAESHHLLLLFGRYVCKSQNPNCENCYLSKYCKYLKSETNV